MKTKLYFVYRLLILLFITIIYLGNSFAPPTGNTGAPGDGTCNGCHFGGSQTGTIGMVGIVDNPIIPNKTYNVSVRIRLLSGSSTQAGFQWVALDGNDALASSTGTVGNFGPNVGLSISGSRTYVQHSGGENTYVGGITTYTFDWTAPASSTNNISFYMAGNIAIGGTTADDLIVFNSVQNVALPVEFIEFKVDDSRSDEIALLWTTKYEQNSDYFEVLRSGNGVDFEMMDRVQAAGNSDSEIDYEYIDRDPIKNRNSFYKLKTVDLDGRFEYTEIKAVQYISKDESILNVFPNPARRDFCLFVDYVSETDRPDAEIHIYDQRGREFLYDAQMESGVQKGFNKYVLDISTLPDGPYFLNLVDNNQVLKSELFIVAK